MKEASDAHTPSSAKAQLPSDLIKSQLPHFRNRLEYCVKAAENAIAKSEKAFAKFEKASAKKTAHALAKSEKDILAEAKKAEKIKKKKKKEASIPLLVAPPASEATHVPDGTGECVNAPPEHVESDRSARTPMSRSSK